MVAKLSVNINAVAMLRNRRDLPWPNLLDIARIALQAGAHGVTVHPRPDQRHIRFSDLAPLRTLLDTEFPQAEFNIEGYPSVDFIELVKFHKPDQVTLVPDDPAQATSDHGWDFMLHEAFLTQCIRQLKLSGFRVAAFCDPDASQDALCAAKRTGADRVELYTGPYGATYNDNLEKNRQANLLKQTALKAQELGMGVNAGHDLTVDNLPTLVAHVPHLAEVSIGHGLTADALIHGYEKTVMRFIEALKT